MHTEMTVKSAPWGRDRRLPTLITINTDDLFLELNAGKIYTAEDGDVPCDFVEYQLTLLDRRLVRNYVPEATGALDSATVASATLNFALCSNYNWFPEANAPTGLPTEHVSGRTDGRGAKRLLEHVAEGLLTPTLSSLIDTNGISPWLSLVILLADSGLYTFNQRQYTLSTVDSSLTVTYTYTDTPNGPCLRSVLLTERVSDNNRRTWLINVGSTFKEELAQALYTLSVTHPPVEFMQHLKLLDK